MICLRHQVCRLTLYRQIRAWPTATYPRYFVVVTAGAIGMLLMVACLIASVPAIWWLTTQTGTW